MTSHSILKTNVSPLDYLKRWTRPRAELLTELDTLRRDNQTLRAKVTALQRERDQLEKHAEERRKGKEALKSRLEEQKKSAEQGQRTQEQLSTRIAELREELDRLSKQKRR